MLDYTCAVLNRQQHTERRFISRLPRDSCHAVWLEVLLAEMGSKTRIQDDLLTLTDATAYLSRSRTYAATMMADGAIPLFKIEFLRRGHRSDTDEYIDSRLAARDDP